MRPRGRGIIGLVSVAAMLAAVLAAALPAQAAFPGRNGRIAFVSNRDGDPEIYSMRPDGTGIRKLTNNSFGDAFPSYSPTDV